MTASAPARRVSGPQPLWDEPLLVTLAALLLIGLIFVYSSSISYAATRMGTAGYFAHRQALFLVVGLLTAAALMRVSLKTLERYSGVAMVAGVAGLVAALIPGVGQEINGSWRWIRLGPIGGQPSEVAKVLFIVYTAALLSRGGDEFHRHGVSLVGPVITLIVICALLLLEPDFGAAAVLIATASGLLLIAGLDWRHFVLMLGGCAGVLAVLAYTSPERLARLTNFLDPWRDPFGESFQLTQALIAFGRGGWFGVGLGQSVQKLFYLPEAHTDFLVAILAEELGLIAVLAVIALYTFVVVRAFAIGKRALMQEQRFASYLAYGVGLLIGVQAFVNIGVNMGLLPTKGLTLPLISYGGTSLVWSVLALTLLLRADHELRLRIQHTILHGLQPVASRSPWVG